MSDQNMVHVLHDASQRASQIQTQLLRTMLQIKHGDYMNKFIQTSAALGRVSLSFSLSLYIHPHDTQNSFEVAVSPACARTMRKRQFSDQEGS